MKLFMTLCLVASLSSGLFATMQPAVAKDAAVKAAKEEAKAAADTNRANEQVAKGHPARAGRAAKKAEKAHEKAAKDEKKAAEGK